MIIEALLEMHFHKALIDLFSDHFGRTCLRFIKPSAREEYKFGFDQAFVRTDSETEFLDELENAISGSSTLVDKLYFAYFFQFKKVDELKRSSSLKPASYHTPYYRSKLSFEPNKNTKISQHETLERLSKVKGALVYYACGMVFENKEIWEPADLEKLRFVPLDSAPNNLNPNQPHFITFQTKKDPKPNWCSEPIEGRSISIYEFIEYEKPKLLKPNELNLLVRESINSLEETSEDLMGSNFNTGSFDPDFIPVSLTILEFDKLKNP